MRFKAIPSDVAATVTAHPALTVAGVALLLGGAYVYTRPVNSPAPDNSYNPTDGNYLSPVAYNLPLATSGASGFSEVSSVSQNIPPTGTELTAVDPNSVSTRELFNFEKLKEQHSYDLTLMQISQNADISAANATLNLQGIQASNFSAAINLATSIFRSGATSLIGAIFGPNGESYSFGLAQTLVADGKKKTKNAGILASNEQGQSALANFLSSMNKGSNNATFTGIGTSPNATYRGATISLPYSTNGNVANASLDASYASNSQPYATIAQSENAIKSSSSVYGNEFIQSSSYPTGKLL